MSNKRKDWDVGESCSLSSEEAEAGGFPTVSLAKLASARPVSGPVSKQGRPPEICQLRLSSGIHEHRYIHVHLHTHGHVHKRKCEKKPKASARLGVVICHAASSDSQRSGWSPGQPSKAIQDCPPIPFSTFDDGRGRPPQPAQDRKHTCCRRRHGRFWIGSG